MSRLCLVVAKQIAGVNFFGHICEFWGGAVGHNQISALFETLQIIHHFRVEEMRRTQRWFINNHGDALGLDALHNALNGGGAEIIRIRFHGYAINTHCFRRFFDDLRGNEILAGGVSI